MNSRDY